MGKLNTNIWYPTGLQVLNCRRSIVLFTKWRRSAVAVLLERDHQFFCPFEPNIPGKYLCRVKGRETYDRSWPFHRRGKAELAG